MRYFNQAVFTPFSQREGLWQDEGTSEVFSLDELHEKHNAVMQHWRFEDGKLFIGTSDLLFEVVGVPHNGNRFVHELLQASGYMSIIHHLAPEPQYRTVMPVRDPRYNLLSHWKRAGEAPVGTMFMDRWYALWDQAWAMKDAMDCVFYVDRQEPAELFEMLDIEAKHLKADWHRHALIKVSMDDYPDEVNTIARRWGY